MAYIKQTWEDRVTPVDAEHMNHIEEGVEQAAKTADDAVQAAGNAANAASEAQAAAENAAAAIPVKTSQLTNDSGFITKAVADLENYLLKSETYTREEVQELLTTVPKFGIEVVDALPEESISATTVYLLRDGEDGNLYTEYIYVNGAWEMLGTQRVDLTDYLKKGDVSALAISGNWNDMLNKPFGEKSVEEIEVTPYTEFTYEYEESVPCVTLQMREEFIKEASYVINIDGEKYTGTVNEYGSLRIYVDNIEGPFFWMSSRQNGTGRAYFAEGSVAEGKNNGTISISRVEEVVEQISEELIPSTIPVIQSAQVGQTVVVKAVDADGKPTEWEAVEMASGGGIDYLLVKNSDLTMENAIKWAKAAQPICWYRLDSTSINLRTNEEYQTYFDDCGSNVYVLKCFGDSFVIDQATNAEIRAAWEEKFGDA